MLPKSAEDHARVGAARLRCVFLIVPPSKGIRSRDVAGSRHWIQAGRNRKPAGDVVLAATVPKAGLLHNSLLHLCIHRLLGGGYRPLGIPRIDCYDMGGGFGSPTAKAEYF